MNMTLKIASLLIIFFLMVSSFAFASFNNSTIMSESASMILIGIGLMSMGGFLRGSIGRR
ncbi:MAG: hypothetical protein BWK80_34465 [Desulfobacteraceae bacterium IS3]|nr:MAG: hypothetical protein BWK80_34465 [Desulfobacteraceae bacterium IS3]